MAAGVATAPKKVAHYIAVCREKTAQLDRLVSDLLAVTTLESMSDTMRRERVALDIVADRLATGLRPEALERRVHLVVDLGAGPYEVMGNADWIARALANLLDNALRYTPPAGRIELTMSRDADAAVIRVRDTGPGISPEVLPHVFEPFYRGDAARAPARGGSGLGLSIAQRVLTAVLPLLRTSASPGPHS